jgi:hypothetical protein
MNPQNPCRHFCRAADQHRRAARFSDERNASLFSVGTLASRGSESAESALAALRASDVFGADICGIAQKYCFQSHLISPRINTYKDSSVSCISLISNDFNSNKNNSSGNKDLKSIRISTSGHKDLKSFRISTYKKHGGGAAPYFGTR